MIKIFTVTDEIIEGEVVSVDPVSKAIVIRKGEGFQMVFPNSISSIEGNIPDVTDAQPIDIEALSKRERSALDSAVQSLESINPRVDPKIQALFDRISFVYPSKWSQDSIVILDQCTIDPPYRAENILPLNDMCTATGLKRIEMMLEGERRKLGI